LEINLFLEGHNIIGTYIIVYPGQTGVEALFGLNVIGSEYSSANGNQEWMQIMTGSSLFTNLHATWDGTSWPGIFYPTLGWSSIVGDAKIAAQNGDGTGVITVYQTSTYVGIYLAYMPEYEGGTDDTQLVYNAITYSGSNSECKIK
jgi:hypothetical protein